VSTDRLTSRETLAIAISRELRDGEVVLTGAASAVPLAAGLVARATHAPNLTVLGAGVYINPARLVPEFTAGWDCKPEAVGDLSDVFALTELGIDVMFYGGMQIDQYGCVNTHHVTTSSGILRGPGMANTALGHTAQRSIVFTERHSRRTLVPEVEYASVVGHRHRGRSRASLGLPGSGPAAIFTPEVVLRPDSDGVMTASAALGVQPWDAVRREVGWDIGERRPPVFEATYEETHVLRCVVDREGLLR
jgi:glutaconate CoA-transferase subunit B